MATVSDKLPRIDDSAINDIIESRIDFLKCERILESFEKYSQKLDKLLETTTQIELKSKRK